MNNPQLVTSHEEAERCCLMLVPTEDGKGGVQCPNKAEFWVGKNGIDDYTHVCAEHVEAVRREGDAVHPLGVG